MTADACSRGHVRTPENTYRYPRTGWRDCRICRRLVDRERRRLAAARGWAWHWPPDQLARMLDEATIAACEATSWSGPRDYLADCRGCGLPFWANGGMVNRRYYCTEVCRKRHLNRMAKRRKLAIPPERWRAGPKTAAA